MRRTINSGIIEDASFKPQRCTQWKNNFLKKSSSLIPKTIMLGAIEYG